MSSAFQPPSADARPILAPTDEARLRCREWFEAHGTAVYNYNQRRLTVGRETFQPIP
jgi:hypothetical protein